jgi:hypothetical protein
MEEIYMVTSVDTPWPQYGDKRCWGWVLTEKEARRVVGCNAGDMHETSYSHVVIEKAQEGLLNIYDVIQWYEWVEGKGWQECVTPKWAEGVVNWAL